MVEIKNGTLDEFFVSAKATAREIDSNQKVTPKHTIWMETEDLLAILKPRRTQLIEYLKDKTKVYYSTMAKELKKSPTSLNRDLDLLLKYQLIDISKESNAGHGIRKVIRPLFPNESLEFRAVV